MPPAEQLWTAVRISVPYVCFIGGIIMANIYKGTLGLIGNTPLVEVTNLEKELGLEARLLVKLEYLNTIMQVFNDMSNRLNGPVFVLAA